MSDVICVVSADLHEERSYILRAGTATAKIEGIVGVEHRAGFAVDSLVHVEEPNVEVLSLTVTGQRVNEFLLH